MGEFDKLFFSTVQKTIKRLGEQSISADATKTHEVVDKILSSYIESSFGKLKSDALEILKRNRAYATGFNRRLMKRWKEPIDLLELLLLISYEMGAKFNQSHREEASKSNDFLFDVLTRQHARACQIGFEIVALLKNGLADGADARWRSLYEIVVVSFFIEKYKRDVPERFLKYEIIESYKQAMEYQKHCQRLGYQPLSPEEIKQLTRLKDGLLETYGKDFYKEYGWIPNTVLHNRSFLEIEALMSFDHLRPYYKMACFNVHSGPKGIGFRLGLMKNSSKSQLLLAGPSNYGLADPGEALAIAIHQITVCLLLTKPTVEGLVVLGVMRKLLDELCPAFVQVQSKIEEDERNLDKKATQIARQGVARA